MKHRQRSIDPDLNKKWMGSKIVRDWSARVEEKDDKVTMNLIICDKCAFLCGGIKYKFMCHNLYGAMSFFELKYVCTNCGNEILLDKEELNRVNKYSKETIDNVNFPRGIKTMIKRDAHIIGSE